MLRAQQITGVHHYSQSGLMEKHPDEHFQIVEPFLPTRKIPFPSQRADSPPPPPTAYDPGTLMGRLIARFGALRIQTLSRFK